MCKDFTQEPEEMPSFETKDTKKKWVPIRLDDKSEGDEKMLFGNGLYSSGERE